MSEDMVMVKTNLLRNDETIISSISVTDIFFDVYLGKWNYRAIPKMKTWSYFLTIPKYIKCVIMNTRVSIIHCSDYSNAKYAIKESHNLIGGLETVSYTHLRAHETD